MSNKLVLNAGILALHLADQKMLEYILTQLVQDDQRV